MSDLKWTNSSLSTLEDCGEKFRRRYIEREYRAPYARMLRGGAVHSAISFSLLRKMEQHELPSVEEVRDVTATAFTKRWEEGVALMPDEREKGEHAVRDYTKDLSIDLAVLHRTAVAPSINPVGVERRITVKPRDMDITIEGTIDQIDGRPEGEMIRDPKSAEKSPAKDMAEDSQQLTMYGLLRLAETGIAPTAYRLDYLVRTPAKRELKHIVLDTTRDATDMNALVQRLNVGVDAVKKGVFMPANPTWWGCSQSWCEFFESCVYTRRGNRPQS